MKKRSDSEAVSLVFWQSPVGWIALIAGRAGVREVLLHADRGTIAARLEERYPGAAAGGPAEEYMAQVQEFFRGERREFSLPLDLDGLSPFTCRVLETLTRVPFGSTVSYGELAALAGRPGAARAVGRAMAVNPIPLVIPCHRVLGAGGCLTGYSGGEGVSTKAWLLRFEGNERIAERGLHPAPAKINNRILKSA